MCVGMSGVAAAQEPRSKLRGTNPEIMEEGDCQNACGTSQTVRRRMRTLVLGTLVVGFDARQ